MIKCNNCGWNINPDTFNKPFPSECECCHTKITVVTFNKYYQSYKGSEKAHDLLSDSQASCFYHPDKKAALDCGHCGRLICNLCDLDLNDQHLCPNCFEKDKSKSNIKQLVSGTTQFDSIAITVAVLLTFVIAVPVVGLVLSILSSIGITIMALKQKGKPQSILPRRKWRFPVAFVILIIQIILSLTLTLKLT